MRTRRRQTSVARAVLVFALSGLAVLLLVGVAGVLVLRRVSTAEAMREAEGITTVAARAIVQPRLTSGILTGDAESLAAVDALVREGVLRDPIVRVKIWAPDGRILYSDAPELIGSSYALGPDQRRALRTDTIDAKLSDLSEPENRLERNLGPLLEVYLPVYTPRGDELLFEAYLRFNAVAASGRDLLRTFLPVLAVALAALALLQIPLAYRLAGRVRDSQRDRERLLRRAIEASDMERRRIAGDLHDGTVQQLAGLSMSLSAKADALADSDPEASGVLLDAAAKTRQGMRSLRSALMGIYPPTLQRAGLPAALSDLAAPLAEYGVQAEVYVPAEVDLPADVERLLFRASQEAIHNVTTHAAAEHVRLAVTADARTAVLEVSDDGAGFSAEQERAARADGHLGLKLLGDLARDADGTLEVRSSPGEGTRIRVEVPLR